MTHDLLPPSWRRPPGVAKGTWQYVHQRSIARHYQSFVADTPLCQLDQRFVLDHLQAESSKAAKQNSETSPPLVVDLGCCNGRLARPISRAGWEVLAIDLSQPMLEELVRQSGDAETAPAGGGAAYTGPGNAQAGTVMPLRANLVELEGVRNGIAAHAVCMFSTLGMVQGSDSRKRFLAHAARIVRPGGTLVLHVHRKWAALRERGGLRRLCANGCVALWNRDVEFGDSVYAYRGLPNMFMHRFSAREIHAELKRSGWQVERLERVDLRGEQITRSTWNASGFLIISRNKSD